ncbi:S-protein homolog 1-like [Momordica charantia]|uniref:S-protein homolog n=1 Tax=Momordica charantia TaxID=3673 RepID=A0A6J1DEX4_MOMCH|nr:S-protein homolog 1-like [Momordica charantia]
MGGIKKPLGFVIVVALVLLGCSTVALATWPMPTWTVDIVNELSNGQELFVHCKSKDDDLGEHNLDSGAQYGFTFKDNVWQTTLFWCYLRKPDNSHAAFDVYWYDISKGHWLYTRCDYKNCIWIAKADGIYIKNIPSNQDELVHPWEN